MRGKNDQQRFRSESENASSLTQVGTEWEVNKDTSAVSCRTGEGKREREPT